MNVCPTALSAHRLFSTRYSVRSVPPMTCPFGPTELKAESYLRVFPKISSRNYHYTDVQTYKVYLKSGCLSPRSTQAFKPSLSPSGCSSYFLNVSSRRPGKSFCLFLRDRYAMFSRENTTTTTVLIEGAGVGMRHRWSRNGRLTRSGS